MARQNVFAEHGIKITPLTGLWSDIRLFRVQPPDYLTKEIEMKHTQGKWEIRHFIDGIRIMTETEHIAKIEHIHEDPQQITYTANARLIAAAPDLLEALIGLTEDDLYNTKYMDMARKAIAKAKGE